MRRGAPWSRSATLVIARKELHEILRDRRALFFAFVLPLLLYPALFWGVGRIEGLREEAAHAHASRIGLLETEGPLADRLRQEPDLEILAVPLDAELLEHHQTDAILAPVFSSGNDPSAPAPAGPAAPLAVYFQSGSPASEEARRRLEHLLADWKLELLEAGLVARGAPSGASRPLPEEEIDLSTPRESSGAALGRLLPFILVTLLLTGGAFAAIDLVAGEKERGTLETLFTQPVAAASIIRGKFIAVLAASLAAVILNLAGMGIAAAAGIGPMGRGAMGLPAVVELPGAGTLLVTLALVAPLAVLTSAVLLAVSTFARTFREAQIFLFPLTLASMAPALLSVLPEIRLSPAVALVPLASTTLAIREALLGEFRWGYLAAAFGSTALYAALALRWAARLLTREDLRLGIEPQAAAGDAGARGRRGLAFAGIMILAVYYFGGWLQQPDGVFGLWGGLALTLWVLVLLPSLAYLPLFRLPVRETLALRMPSPRALIAAVLLAPLAMVLIRGYLELQDSILPFPEGVAKELEKIFSPELLDPTLRFLLIAISPAICEEILWRGVVQGELEREDRPTREVLLVGILFGVFHLNAFRLVPTALLGFLLAYLRRATRSIAPGMLFHALYNAGMVFGAAQLERLWNGSPWKSLAVALAGGAMAIVLLWVQRRSAENR